MSSGKPRPSNRERRKETLEERRQRGIEQFIVSYIRNEERYSGVLFYWLEPEMNDSQLAVILPLPSIYPGIEE